MIKLPDISNETPAVQDWLTQEVNSNELAKKYNIANGHSLGAKVRRERKIPIVTINTKEELEEFQKLVPGKITFSHWLKLSPAKSNKLIIDLLAPDELLNELYVNKGMSNRDIANWINNPYITKDIIANRVKQLHLKHKEGDTELIRMRGISDYLKDDKRVTQRNNRQLETMRNKYNTNTLSPFAVKQFKLNKLDWHQTNYVDSIELAYKLLHTKDSKGNLVELVSLLNTIKNKGDYDYFSVSDIAKIVGIPHSTIANYFTLGNINIDGKLIVTNYRGLQNDIADNIKSLGITDNQIKFDSYPEFMDNKQLDIYLPEYNFAIEFNGTHWHANKGNNIVEPKDIHYHANKTSLARKAGINLMHIWEYDWLDDTKRAIIESQIKYHLNKLPKENRYYARKLELKQVSYNDTKDFLNTNHIQGTSISSERYGLYNSDELVALMTFGKRRFDNKPGWELLRFANKINHSVAGGASKLLKTFISNHIGETLISYANNDFSYSGSKSLYAQLGFTYIKTTEPGYKWVTTGRTQQVVPRYSVQPYKLKAFTNGTGPQTFINEVPDYQEDDTESSYMVRHGFYKVYDAGNDLYELDM